MQMTSSRAAALSTARAVFAPSAERSTRTSTTVTLVVVALCGLLADRALLGDATPPAVPAAQNQVTQNQVTKVIAPEFCKDQTWPYLDGRCLRRIEIPTPLAPPPTRQDAPPSNTVAAAPADSQAAASAPPPDDAKQVFDQVFPRAAQSAPPPNDAPAAASDAPPYQRTSEAPPHRSRHWGGDYNRSFDARF